MGFINSCVAALNSVAISMTNVMLDGESKFDLIKFLENASNYVKKVGHWIMVFAGIILVIVAVVQIAKGFASGGRGQVNWVMSLACLLVGGMLIFGGWNLATGIASIGADTIAEMGGIEGGIGMSDDGTADKVGGGMSDYASAS